MIDVKAFHVLAAQHIGAQQIVILIGDAGQQFVIKATHHHVALQVGAGRVHLLRGAMGTVNPAGEVAGRRVIGHHSRLVIVVVILAVAVIEARGPGVVKAILGVQLGEVGIAIGNIKRFIEAGFAIDVHRMPGIEIEDSAAVEGGAVVAVRIGRGHRRPVAKPGQGRGDKAAFVFTKVAPVILILIFADQPVRQIRAFDGSGDVDAAGAAAKAGGGPGNRTGELPLRTFGDDVDQPAGIENTVQRRGGSLQDFHPFGGGVKAARQHGAQAVGHDRAVAVSAEAAAGKSVLGAAKGVGLHHVGYVIQRLIERGGVLIFENPIADGIHHLRNIQQRH
ncbi:Uncharacterised protein [Klebsiella quasipneumoniae]|nr:Uncharacterised protein [Klebsiella quasipneumoniae]